MNGNSLPTGLIFDMDGVLVDSNPFHVRNWMAFLDARGISYNAQTLPRQVLGVRNDKSFRIFFGPEVSDEEIDRLAYELEVGFRRLFQAHAKLQPGVVALIEECLRAGIPMAVASSAPPENVNFIVDTLNVRRHFHSVLSGAEVTHPKPHPEIYLKSAEKLGVDPSQCVAFEDSFPGIESASNAGMKVIAIASTFPHADLETHGRAQLVVDSFEELSLAYLRNLFGT